MERQQVVTNGEMFFIGVLILGAAVGLVLWSLAEWRRDRIAADDQRRFEYAARTMRAVESDDMAYLRFVEEQMVEDSKRSHPSYWRDGDR